MLLNEKPNLNVEENSDFILYCALLSNEPCITLNDLRDIPAGQRVELARELLAEPQPTNEKINDLYSCAVGEIGINPNDAWAMTEEEIDLAYEGYVHRQEMQANLFLFALHKAQKQSWDNIHILEDKGYSIGTEEERKKVFSNLGIEV